MDTSNQSTTLIHIWHKGAGMDIKRRKQYKKRYWVDFEAEQIKEICTCGAPMNSHGICWDCNVCERIILKR
jgi:hypothetical protein